MEAIKTIVSRFIRNVETTLIAKRILINQYNNINRQIRMHQILQSTTLSSIMYQHACDTNVALETLCDIITTYRPQGPMSYRLEEGKVEHLQNTLAVVERAKSALTECYAYDLLWTFHHYTLLSAPLGYKNSVREKPTLPLIAPLMYILDHNRHM